MWQFHFPQNNCKQEQAVDPLIDPKVKKAKKHRQDIYYYKTIVFYFNFFGYKLPQTAASIFFHLRVNWRQA